VGAGSQDDQVWLVAETRSARRCPALKILKSHSKISTVAPAPRRPVLVVDDSLTTRMVEQSILESAGHVVEVARSGEEALEKVRYARLTGTREEKLAKLKAIRCFGDVTWEDCFDGATEPMWPQRAGNYFAWPLLTDLWPWQGCGVKFERNWPIGETRELLETRWQALLAASPEEKPTLFREDDDRKVLRQYTALRPPRERPMAWFASPLFRPLPSDAL